MCIICPRVWNSKLFICVKNVKTFGHHILEPRVLKCASLDDVQWDRWSLTRWFPPCSHQWWGRMKPGRGVVKRIWASFTCAHACSTGRFIPLKLLINNQSLHMMCTLSPRMRQKLQSLKGLLVMRVHRCIQGFERKVNGELSMWKSVIRRPWRKSAVSSSFEAKSLH